MSIINKVQKARMMLTDLVAGTRFLRVLDILRKHQYLDPQQLNSIRESTFYSMLNRAKSSTPYYKELISYHKLPILTKDDVRKNFNAFVSTAYKGKKYKKGTGGSTGNPLIYYSTPLVRSYLWAGILLSWEAAGYHLGEKVAFIAGTSILKKDLRHLFFYKMMNIQVYSAFTLDDRSVANYIERLKISKTRIVYAYASALQVMAEYINKNGPCYFPHLRSVISTAEVLSEQARNEISAAFNVEVYNQYGCNEAGISAFECEYHNMHLISTRCYFETDENNGLVSSDMINEAFVMLRYHTGDIVEFSSESRCQCGRTYPIIRKIVGRTFDIVRDNKNNMLHSAYFSMLFRNDPYIRQFQIMVSKEKIAIHLNVSEDRNDVKYFNHYIDEIKKRLSFNEYNLYLNSPFFRLANAKHRHIINLD